MQMNKTVTEIADALKAGKIIATPTDTVWGLLVDGSNKSAVEALYKLKERDISKQLIVFTAGEDKLTSIVDNIPEYAHAFIQKFWPGKLTLVLPTKLKIYAKQQTETIGVRMPNMPHLLALLETSDLHILSTSANKAGAQVLCDGAEITKVFGVKVLVWEPNDADHLKDVGTISSTVVDCTEDNSWEILREGAVSKEELWQVLV